MSTIAVIGRAIRFMESNQEKKHRVYTKNEANKTLSNNNFTRSNREKTIIAITILEIVIMDSTIIILHFGGTNDVFFDPFFMLLFSIAPCKVIVTQSFVCLIFGINSVLLFFIALHESYRFFYCDNDSCCSFSLLNCNKISVTFCYRL